MSRPFDASYLTELAGKLQAQPDEGITIDAVLGNALEVIPEAELASLTVRASRGRFRTLGSTGEIATTADQLQYSLHEGPCVESLETGEWFRSGDAAADPRWPSWGPAAAGAGVRSFLSVRLLAHGEPFGAMNLYSTRRGCFRSRESVEIVLLYAVHAANALRTAQLVSGLETALGSRHRIGAAQGVLMERFGLTVDQAFAFLGRLSQTLNRKLSDIADEIVTTSQVPSLDRSAGEPTQQEVLHAAGVIGGRIDRGREEKR